MSKTSPYIRRQNLILESRLSPTQKLVLLILHFRYGRNGLSFPSQTSIARDAGLTRQGVNRIVRKLVEQKLLIVTNGPRQSLAYMLNEDLIGQNCRDETLGINSSITKTCDSELHLPVTEDHTSTCDSELHLPVTRSDTSCNSELQPLSLGVTRKSKRTEKRTVPRNSQVGETAQKAKITGEEEISDEQEEAIISSDFDEPEEPEENEFHPFNSGEQRLSDYLKRDKSFVERIENEISFIRSRWDMKDIAHSWRDLKRQLPEDIKPHHIITAIQSPAYEGINQKAWGWFLSAGKNFAQFVEVIMRQYQTEREIKKSTKASIRRAITYIKDKDAEKRFAAVGAISMYANGGIPKATARRALELLAKDGSEKVRNEAKSKLELLFELGVLPTEKIEEEERDPVGRS